MFASLYFWYDIYNVKLRVKRGNDMNIIFAIIMGYFLGSIPSGLIVAGRYKVDLRKHGSGNIGGTNAFRVLGKKAGILVTISDIVKGMIPTWIALQYFGGETLAIIAGLSAILGHSFSLFANFKGGKSVATGAGVMLILNPLSILFAILTFAIVLFTSRYVSLASMIAAISAALSVWLMDNSLLLKMIILFIVLFIVIRHQTNIKRLIQGKENKVFQKKKQR